MACKVMYVRVPSSRPGALLIVTEVLTILLTLNPTRPQPYSPLAACDEPLNCAWRLLLLCLALAAVWQ